MQVLVPIDQERRRRLLDALDAHERLLEDALEKVRSFLAWSAAEAGQTEVIRADDVHRGDTIRPADSPGFHVVKDMTIAMPVAVLAAETVDGPQVVVVTTADGVYELELDELIECHRTEVTS